MKAEDFLNQKAKDMTIEELKSAIKIKEKQKEANKINPIEAYRAMQEGKKCKGSKGDIWTIRTNELYHGEDKCRYIDLFMCEVFEIVEDKQVVLSNLIMDIGTTPVEDWIYCRFVKKSLKELIDYFNENVSLLNLDKLKQKAKEILGSRLI